VFFFFGANVAFHLYIFHQLSCRSLFIVTIRLFLLDRRMYHLESNLPLIHSKQNEVLVVFNGRVQSWLRSILNYSRHSVEMQNEPCSKSWGWFLRSCADILSSTKSSVGGHTLGCSGLCPWQLLWTHRILNHIPAASYRNILERSYVQLPTIQRITDFGIMYSSKSLPSLLTRWCSFATSSSFSGSQSKSQSVNPAHLAM